MSTIANAKVAHNYNRYNGYFFGCLPYFFLPIENLRLCLLMAFIIIVFWGGASSLVRIQSSRYASHSTLKIFQGSKFVVIVVRHI